MKHTYRAFFTINKKHPKRAICEFVARFPGLELDDMGDMVVSEDAKAMQKLGRMARREGIDCSVEVTTEYTREDSLSGDLGNLGVGITGSNQFRPTLPKDAFDFSTGCRKCHLGAVQVKPYLLSERSIRCKGPFYYALPPFRPFMKAEIGHEIIEATNQPGCMRHPVTRSGKVVREWLEPVPSMTMPPLSPKSEGVLLGESRRGPAHPPHSPCPVCGRTYWDFAFEVPTRLVYPHDALREAQKHAVVSMFEPFTSYPEFDPAKGTYKNVYGLPLLLFNHRAVEVLVKYTKTGQVRDSSSVTPVFGE